MIVLGIILCGVAVMFGHAVWRDSACDTCRREWRWETSRGRFCDKCFYREVKR